MFKAKTLLITGGTGCFGNAVLRRFLQTDIGEIRIFSRDETKQDDMRTHYVNPKIRFFIGDVRDESSLHDAMRGVDFVFHAAALKQVPSSEFFPIEVLKTNALGTENVLNAAVAANVKRLIVLSSDKAVYPISALGMSNALMEKLAVAKSRLAGQGTLICCTRFGSVMGSRGSVIPLFINQIQEGRTVTVTDPCMTRFMMTIEDAVNLVIHAFQYGSAGDTFVSKAPSCSIEVLAEALKKLLDSDMPVEVVGARHGEKFYETLLTSEEMAVAEDQGAYCRVPADNRDLTYSAYLNRGDRAAMFRDEYNSQNCDIMDVDSMCELLMQVECVRTAMSGIKVTL
jgi:UDP-N-acetylglucosamine 4,6-dehydratase/5-epimerase